MQLGSCLWTAATSCTPLLGQSIGLGGSGASYSGPFSSTVGLQLPLSSDCSPGVYKSSLNIVTFLSIANYTVQCFLIFTQGLMFIFWFVLLHDCAFGFF